MGVTWKYIHTELSDCLSQLLKPLRVCLGLPLSSFGLKTVFKMGFEMSNFKLFFVLISFTSSSSHPHIGLLEEHEAANDGKTMMLQLNDYDKGDKRCNVTTAFDEMCLTSRNPAYWRSDVISIR